tara:strand:+ start:1480 stop:1617 length:138 start_codon:yes stop_codon:yes gene_type:complete
MKESKMEPKVYTMFVSFTAMNIKQAVEYVQNLDNKDILSCIEVDE